MKTIDEIEKLSLEDLERISMDESIPVPEGLTERVSPQRRGGQIKLWAVSVAASLVLIAGLALTLRPAPLKDTFDDPAVAYAEVEKALVNFTEVVSNQMNSINR